MGWVLSSSGMVSIGYHGDGAGLALDAARALVHGGKVGIQVAGVAAAAGHLLAGGGNLAQGLGVVGYIGEYNQHVHALVIMPGTPRRSAPCAGVAMRSMAGSLARFMNSDGAVDGAGCA